MVVSLFLLLEFLLHLEHLGLELVQLLLLRLKLLPDLSGPKTEDVFGLL